MNTLFSTAKEQDGQILEMPFLAFNYKHPSDGLPLLQEWLNTAQDIFSLGYEGMREPMEITVAGDGAPGFASANVSKGLGRISILWFGVLFTYFKLRESMSDEMKADFKRWEGGDNLHRLLRNKNLKVQKVMVSLKPSPFNSFMDIEILNMG